MQTADLQSLFESYQQELKSKQVANKLGKRQCFVSNIFSMFQHGGYDLTHDLLGDRKYVDYSVTDLIQIADDLVVNSIGIVKGIVKYCIEYNRIAKLIKIRKDKDASLTITDIEQLTWANDCSVRREDNMLPKEVKKAKHSQLLVANYLTEEEEEEEEVKKKSNKASSCW